ncbi:phage tail protein [Pseudomonas weihenstephanensis]|uniref:phage tail protein n=1 Tax=Pseudomonas weihenstephanensis TaxID=1608994 RepID=UPI00069F1A99|nr:phage tail protein [Pseudomonas weihenstephanensis]
MGASITLAGESLIAQKVGAQQPLIVSRFVLANVPGLNPNGPVNRGAAKPPVSQIVATYDVTQKGFVNPNQVVYSLMMGSDIGDFDWNWIGLETADNVLLAVAYVPVQQKRRNIPPLQIGNNVTRNFLVVFDGAQALTGITIDAKTWQHDFTVRLHSIDERERLSNRDMFGRSCFFDGGFQLEKVGAVYQLKPGIAYIEGVRVLSAAATPVAPANLPTKAWLDVCLERQLSDAVVSWKVTFGASLPDYTDSVGVRHYVVPLADIPNSNTITDIRKPEPITDALVKHFAGRSWVESELLKKANKGTTLKDYGITDAIQNVNPLPGTSLDLHGGQFAFVSAESETHLCQNCYWNGKAWLRHDVAKPAVVLVGGGGRLRVQRASAGENPIVWTSSASIRDSGDTYSIVEIDRLLTALNLVVDSKADKATTLGGYGITDAIPNLNPLPNNSLDIHAGSFGFVSSILESSLCQNCYYADGRWMRHDTNKPAACIAVTNGRAIIRKAAAGANPIVWTYDATLMDSLNTYSANQVDDLLVPINNAIDKTNVNVGQINKDLVVINKTLDKKADKGTTLKDYGITDAIPNRNPLSGDSLDIHAGQYGFLSSISETSLSQNCYWDGAKWMRHNTGLPAVVMAGAAGQLIVRRAEAGANPIVFKGQATIIDSSKLATTADVGVARIASDAQIDAGNDDSTIVTPKKLRRGCSWSIGRNGYFAAPTWLGGWVLQWATTSECISSSDYRYFPTPFPNECFGMLFSLMSSTQGGFGNNFGMVHQVVDSSRFLWSAGGTFSHEGQAFFLALGK